MQQPALISAAKSLSLSSFLLAAGTGCPLEPPSNGGSICSASDESDLEAWATNPENVEDCVLEIRNTSLASLDALDGLDGLHRVNGFIIEDNPELRDVDALALLEPFPLLTIRRSPLAATLDVSNVLDDVRVEETEVVNVVGDQTSLALLQVREGSLIQTISFPNVESVGSINIERNPILENLGAAFPVVTAITRLSVTDSPLVTTAEIEALAAQASVPAADVFHCGNADDEICEDVP